MMPNKSKIDIAIVQTDLKWIKEKLTSIDNNINSIKGCVDGHDDRIQSLENWKKYSDEQFNKSMIKWGVVVSIISVAISILIAMWR